MKEVKQSYNGVRNDLLNIVNINYTGKSILDVGCYRGANAQYLKSFYSGVKYVGLEYDLDAVNNKVVEADKIYQVDLDFFDERILGQKFDVIILGDVIEHLKYPEVLLKKLANVATEECVFLISIPNIQYYQAILLIILGRFPRRERGIFDKTHLRWFTKFEFINMVSPSFSVIKFKRKFRLVESNKSKFNRFGRLFTPIFWLFYPYFTFQMQFALKKRG